MRVSPAMLPLLVISASALNAPAPHRRLARASLGQRIAAREIDSRAGGVIPEDVEQQMQAEAASSAAAAAAAAQPSTESVTPTSISSEVAQSSSAVEQSSAVSTVLSVAPTSSAVPVSSVAPVTSASPSPVQQESAVVTVSSASPSPIQQAQSSAAPSSANNALSTLPTVAAQLTSTVTRSAVPTRYTTATQTESTNPSSTLGSANTDTEKKGGLSQSALIAIIVVASVVGCAAIGWTLFRRYKLRPSRRFDEKMKPIDFSPHNDGLSDDYLEKTLHRTPSHSAAARQRQEFISELDASNNDSLTAGIPAHDFTAPGPMHNGAYGAPAYDADTYNHDPFAHAQAYDYEQGYYGQQQHVQQYDPSYGGNQDYPTQDRTSPVQDEGYADLQRGNSVGSGSGHSHHEHRSQDHQVYHEHVSQDHQVYPSEFPNPNSYLGRPTGGMDGPYAQAATYRM